MSVLSHECQCLAYSLTTTLPTLLVVKTRWAYTIIVANNNNNNNNNKNNNTNNNNINEDNTNRLIIRYIIIIRRHCDMTTPTYDYDYDNYDDDKDSHDYEPVLQSSYLLDLFERHGVLNLGPHLRWSPDSSFCLLYTSPSPRDS
eukprot:TRINITY_DN10083_c0_g1_i3.p1 TRINITY_DN10083_c0_g1~~TRINITY_DN10083_c0_g1_i3.p1  ORF type:complete len:144 (-),score=28.93 TRINITY_DN10083_c0_g1_i3:93-524(-)